MGNEFRSILEAQWAVFFDKAGIEYQYLLEGYKNSDGMKCIIDFYLPEYDIHAVVKKDKEGAQGDIQMCTRMIEWGGRIKNILILSDFPGDYDGGLWHFPMLYLNGSLRPFDANVLCEWAYFCETPENKIILRVPSSLCNYPRPYWYNKNTGLYEYQIGCVSDRILKKYSKRLSDVQSCIIEESAEKASYEYIFDTNKALFDALLYARNA